MPFDRVRLWWSLTRRARAGEFGPSFNSRSIDASVLAQKLAALHPETPDDDLAKELRPVVGAKGVKVADVLSLLQDPVGDDPDTYARARQLVELAAGNET